MTDKAYIVANEQQESEILEKLEREGLKWKGFSKEPTQWLPTRDIGYGTSFPYILFGDDVVSWCSISELKDNYEIIFDGRKEEYMSEKYRASQGFMNELEEWKTGLNINGQYYVSDEDIFDTPVVVEDWWKDDTHALEQNNRLIAIIRWVNGEDMFEVEKPKKWVVRSKEHNNFCEYTYVTTDDIFSLAITMGVENATRFDTKEEAESWANSHQEVIEVVDV